MSDTACETANSGLSAILQPYTVGKYSGDSRRYRREYLYLSWHTGQGHQRMQKVPEDSSLASYSETQADNAAAFPHQGSLVEYQLRAVASVEQLEIRVLKRGS